MKVKATPMPSPSSTATSAPLDKRPDTVKQPPGDGQCKGEVVVIEKACDRPGGVSNADKWIIAAILAVIFVVLACPIAFGITNWVFKRVSLPTVNKHGRPTIAGLIIHGLVFFIVVRLLMH